MSLVYVMGSWIVLVQVHANPMAPGSLSAGISSDTKYYPAKWTCPVFPDGRDMTFEGTLSVSTEYVYFWSTWDAEFIMIKGSPWAHHCYQSQLRRWLQGHRKGLSPVSQQARWGKRRPQSFTRSAINQMGSRAAYPSAMLSQAAQVTQTLLGRCRDKMSFPRITRLGLLLPLDLGPALLSMPLGIPQRSYATM